MDQFPDNNVPPKSPAPVDASTIPSAMEKHGFSKKEVLMVRTALAGAPEALSRFVLGDKDASEAAKRIAEDTGLDEKATVALLERLEDSGIVRRASKKKEAPEKAKDSPKAKESPSPVEAEKPKEEEEPYTVKLEYTPGPSEPTEFLEPFTVSSLGFIWYDRNPCITGSTLILESSANAIRKGAYQGKRDVEFVRLPEKLVVIEDEAFLGCSIDSVRFPESLRSIGEKAFAGCSLKTVEIPQSVRYIGTSAFDCKTLERINVNEANRFYSSLGGVLFDCARKVLFCYPRKRPGTVYAVPSTVVVIARNAFEFSELETITLHSGIEYIGDNAFHQSNLKHIELPSKLRHIGESAFAITQLESVKIPHGIRVIPKGLFAICERLAHVEFNDDLEEISGAAFTGCAISTLEFPASLKKVDYYAFSNCPLRNLTLPPSIEFIGKNAFHGYCLLDVTLSASMEKLEEEVFCECT